MSTKRSAGDETTRKMSLAIHPGEHIADELAARGMTAAELARAREARAA